MQAAAGTNFRIFYTYVAVSMTIASSQDVGILASEWPVHDVM